MVPGVIKRLFWQRQDERLQQFAETEAFLGGSRPGIG